MVRRYVDAAHWFLYWWYCSSIPGTAAIDDLAGELSELCIV